MPTYALLGADLYLPPTQCTGGGGGPESTGKTSKPELPVPSALSGAQLDLRKNLIMKLVTNRGKTAIKIKIQWES